MDVNVLKEEHLKVFIEALPHFLEITQEDFRVTVLDLNEMKVLAMVSTDTFNGTFKAGDTIVDGNGNLQENEEMQKIHFSDNVKGNFGCTCKRCQFTGI